MTTSTENKTQHDVTTHVAPSGISKAEPVMVLIHEDQYGGGTRQTFHILNELARRNMQAILVSNTHDSWLGDQIEKTGINVKRINTDLIQRAINPIQDFRTLLFLIKTMKQERPKSMITAGVKLIGLGCLAAWFCGVPNKLVIVRGRGAGEQSKLYLAVKMMEKFVSLLGTSFITVAEFNRQQMIRDGVTQADNIYTIHNGTDIQWAQSGMQGRFRTEFNIDPDAHLIGMVGRLTKQKRYLFFIDMIKELVNKHPDKTINGKKIHAVIIGDGPTRDTLQARINQHNLQDVITITGYYATMPDAYADLNVSCLFTYYEGLPNALLESSAAGIPMIADRICGNPEIVQHNKNGFIVEPEDMQTTIKHLETLITDTSVYKTCSDEGKRIATEEFNHRDQISKIVDYTIHFAEKDT